MRTVSTSETDYGMASNGMHVGSGFDVHVRRDSRNFALVNVMSPDGKYDVLAVVDIEPDEDLQALAVEIGNCPNAAGLDYISVEDEGWDDLAERWNTRAGWTP